MPVVKEEFRHRGIEDQMALPFPGVGQGQLHLLLIDSQRERGSGRFRAERPPRPPSRIERATRPAADFQTISAATFAISMEARICPRASDGVSRVMDLNSFARSDSAAGARRM